MRLSIIIVVTVLAVSVAVGYFLLCVGANKIEKREERGEGDE